MVNPPGFNQGILDWQNSLPGFGVPYAGQKNGLINSQFVAAMMVLEAKYKAFGEIFSGAGVKMSVPEAQKKYLQTTEQPKIESVKPDLKSWETFLSQNLPVVGKVYDGDLAVAGKKLEAAIEKSINKPMTGIIWSDTKKQFNTTPDDIKRALDLIQAYQKNTAKTAEFAQDDRIFQMAKFLSEKSA